MKSSPKITIRDSSSAVRAESAFATISGPIPEGSPRVIPILAEWADWDGEWEVMNLGLWAHGENAAVRDHKHLQAHLASVTLITGAL
jgi:hypothetical protein